MNTEVLIISAAANFGSELGVALAQRGAYRVALVNDGATALARVEQGLVLLDSLDEEAGRALVQQLRETKPGLAVHFTPQAAGVKAALEQLQPDTDEMDAAPLEPLAGDESDASSWRFVREPEFLRGLVPAAPAANPDIGEEESLPDEETQCLLAVSAEVSDDGKDETPPNDLMALALVTGAVYVVLTRDGQEVACAGGLDEATVASIHALGADGAGSQVAVSLFLVDSPDLQESCLLYVGNAGALRLSLLVPDDCSPRALRAACDGYLESLA